MEGGVHAEEDAAQRREGRADRGERDGHRSVVRVDSQGGRSRGQPGVLGCAHAFAPGKPRCRARARRARSWHKPTFRYDGPFQSRSRSRPWLRLSSSASGKSPQARRRSRTAAAASGNRSGLATRPARTGRGLSDGRAAPRTRPRPAPRARAPRGRPRAAGGARTARRSTASRPGARPRARRGRPRPRCSARVAGRGRRAASRKTAGSGLPRPTSSAETTRSRYWPSAASDSNTASMFGRGAEEARAWRQPAPRRRSNHERAPGSSVEALLAQQASVGLLLGLAHALDPLRLDPLAEQLVQDLVVALAERVREVARRHACGQRRPACRARRSSGGRPSRSGCRPGPRARRRPSPM